MTPAQKRERVAHLLDVAHDLGASIHELYAGEESGTEFEQAIELAHDAAAKLGMHLSRARDVITRHPRQAAVQ